MSMHQHVRSPTEQIIAEYLARHPDDSPERVAAETGVHPDDVRRADIYLRVRLARVAGDAARHPPPQRH